MNYCSCQYKEIAPINLFKNKELHKTKKGKEKFENFLSRLVERTGVEPVIPP